MVKVSDIIADFLKEKEIKTVFGIILNNFLRATFFFCLAGLEVHN